MKKTLYSILALIAILTTSCNKDIDYTDPNVLSGTTWRCDNFSDNPTYVDYDYLEYKFISTDSVESWHKEKKDSASRKNFTIFYTVHDCTLTLFRKKFGQKKPESDSTTVTKQDSTIVAKQDSIIVAKQDTTPSPTLTIGLKSLSSTTLYFYLYKKE